MPGASLKQRSVQALLPPCSGPGATLAPTWPEDLRALAPPHRLPRKGRAQLSKRSAPPGMATRAVSVAGKSSAGRHRVWPLACAAGQGGRLSGGRSLPGSRGWAAAPGAPSTCPSRPLGPRRERRGQRAESAGLNASPKASSQAVPSPPCPAQRHSKGASAACPQAPSSAGRLPWEGRSCDPAPEAAVLRVWGGRVRRSQKLGVAVTEGGVPTCAQLALQVLLCLQKPAGTLGQKSQLAPLGPGGKQKETQRRDRGPHARTAGGWGVASARPQAGGLSRALA